MELYTNYPKKKNNFPKYLVIIVITAVLTLFTDRTIQKANEVDEFAQRLDIEQENIEENEVKEEKDERPSEDYIEDVLKGTVGISLIKPTGSNIFDINIEQKWGIGTGIIVSEKGYILTNQHLARQRGAKVMVTLNNGKSVQGKIVWIEENIDLAIVKIEESNLKTVRLGDSDNLKIGNEVIAIGNPLGVEFQGTTTKGIVSGLDRTIMFEENGEKVFMEGLIQTDASINPGNSGGPLINEEGEVVGINTVKITSAEGIGFAVPINIVKNVIDAFERNDMFVEASLGIYAYDSEAIRYMEKNNNFDAGIYVVEVKEDGPCYKSGLEEGDIITKIDGVEINKMTELREYLYSKKPGDKVTLNVEDGESKVLEIVLRKRLGKSESAKGRPLATCKKSHVIKTCDF